MFKSKHSGWTWDLKRTPFGGGGGSWNPVAAITDPISQALGTSGGGGGALGALASIDPGPAIGQGLASTDKFLTNLTPYGWALPAAIVAAYFTAGASLGVDAAIEGGALTAGEMAAAEAAATTAGETAFSEAVAAGLTEEAATAAANAAADSALAASTGMEAGTGLEALGASGGTELTGGAGDVFAGYSPTGSAAGTAGETVGSYGAGATGAGAAGGGGGGGGANIGLGTNAPLQGPTYGELGVTGVPEGGAGPTYGEMGYTGLNQNEAIAAANAASQKAALVEALKTANQVRQVGSTANSLSKLLTQGAGSGLSSSLGQLAKGANPQGQALTPWVHGNTNPFVQMATQPIRNATTPDLASLANLLKQG